MPSLCNNIAVNNPCKTFPDANCVVYTGSDLPNTGIKTNDRLSLILHKLDNTASTNALNFIDPIHRVGNTVSWIGTTTDVPEGTNLYYTNPRVKSYADTLYVSLAGSYTDPSWLVSLPYSKITGVPTHTSSFINDGSDGTHPYINLNDIPPQVFTSDITVSLSGGKTLGRYVNADIIPSTGKTPEQVMFLIAQEPINPVVNLSSSSVVQFNQTAVSNVLNFSYTIESLPPATVSTCLLEWRRNNTGAWTTLSTSTSITTFTHSLTDSAFNTQPFNYRYTVTDNQGAIGVATFNITPVAYVAPSTTLVQVATALNGTQTNTHRETGNVSTDLTCNPITRNSPYVDLVSYKIQYSINSGSWTDLSGVTGSLSGGSGSMTPHTDNTLSNTSNTIQYRIVVTDTFTSNTYNSSSILFDYLYLYGYSTINGALTSAQIYALGNGTLQSTIGRTLYPVTAPVANWTYIAIKSSIGTISNIIQDGATPVYGAFNNAPYTSAEVVTNQYGVTANYDLYKSNASNAFTNNSLLIS